MSIIAILLILVIIVALIFEYINGFHDSANAIATVVATKVLSPKNAVIYGAVLNFVGAFAGTHVAKTISKGLLHTDSTTQTVILCALIGAVIWNLITWYYGIPSSSSHALIGGLLGASMFKYGFNVVNIKGLSEKVLIPMITSPILGLVIGFALMLILIWVFHKANPEFVNTGFRKLQLLSSGIMAFSHGSNDAQKTMGIITLALFSFGALKTNDVPLWVIFVCALMMALGTMAGGWRIIRTMGTKVIKLKPIHGFAAETSAATVILTASHFGIPISTTHVISASIMGVGSTLRLSAVKWSLVLNIVFAWIVTIPVCMILSGTAYAILSRFPMIAMH
jgi:PiT family inorganic phosphate transporter